MQKKLNLIAARQLIENPEHFTNKWFYTDKDDNFLHTPFDERIHKRSGVGALMDIVMLSRLSFWITLFSPEWQTLRIFALTEQDQTLEYWKQFFYWTKDKTHEQIIADYDAAIYICDMILQEETVDEILQGYEEALEIVKERWSFSDRKENGESTTWDNPFCHTYSLWGAVKFAFENKQKNPILIKYALRTLSPTIFQVKSKDGAVKYLETVIKRIEFNGLS